MQAVVENLLLSIASFFLFLLRINNPNIVFSNQLIYRNSASLQKGSTAAMQCHKNPSSNRATNLGEQINKRILSKCLAPHQCKRPPPEEDHSSLFLFFGLPFNYDQTFVCIHSCFYSSIGNSFADSESSQTIPRPILSTTSD